MSARHELKRLERLAGSVARVVAEPSPTSWHPCPTAAAMRSWNRSDDVMADLRDMTERWRAEAEHSRACADCVPSGTPSFKQAPARWQRYHAAWDSWRATEAMA